MLDAHNNSISNESNVSFRMLSGKEAQNKAALLNSKINNNFSLDIGMAYRTTTENNTNGTIDYDNILEVIDTSGVANYTFKIINHPDDSETVFHNLVLSDDGTEQKITLIKYEYENNATKMENFEGKITVRSLSSEESCDETNIDGNLSTGTFSPSPGGGSNAGATYPDIPGSGTTDPGGTGSSGSGSGSGGFLTVSDEPASFHCNSCSFSAYSWEQYSGHTDAAGNIYDFTIILNMGRMADLNPDPNPCDAGGAIGIIDEDVMNDCEELKQKVSDDEVTRNRLYQLTINEGQKEKGLRIDKNPITGTYQTSQVINPPNSFRQIKITTLPYTAMIAHSHPDDEVYEMYSGPDIIKIAQIVKKVQNSSDTTVELTEITHILVTQDNYYAMRFDDKASALKLLEIFNDENDRSDFEDKLEKDYRNDNTGPPLYQDTSTIGSQMQHIYSLFAKYGLNMTIYKADKDADNRPTDWNKINKENLNEEPCN